MNVQFKFACAIFAAALLSGPALAEPKKHRGAHGDGYHHAHCPPGLSKKSPACIPPGQAKRHHKKHHERHHTRRHHHIGERLNLEDYVFITNPGRYGLDERDGRAYYRDEYGIYGVDPETRKLIAVLNLIEAFAD